MIYEYIDTIEVLAKSDTLRDGKIDDYLKEVLIRTARVLNCARVNVWELNEDHTVLSNLHAYYKSNNTFGQEEELRWDDFPKYFEYLVKNDIIVSNDARSEVENAELVDTYLKPFDIYSMIDVPLRSEGEMIGVLCFEQTGSFHKWTPEEQKFVLSVAQLVSLALEAQKKREYHKKLIKLQVQKEILMSEINHRVENNISMILSLIDTQCGKSHDAYHEHLFRDLRSKISSMAAVQDQLRIDNHVDEIHVHEYMSELVDQLKSSMDSENKVDVKMNIDEFSLDITKAIPLSLIANELITHSFRFSALNKSDHPIITIDCIRENSHVKLSIKDNGLGLNYDTGDGMGMEMVENLSKQLDGKLEVNNEDNCTELDLEFPV